MRTPEKPYDQKPDFGTILDKHRQLPFKRFMDLIGSKLDDLNELINRPAPYDQGPGRIIPYAIPCLFGPLPITTARRYSQNFGGPPGHESLATVADPSTFFTPRDGDILIDREFSFRCYSMSAYGFLNWGYKSDPGFAVPYTNPNGVGDILDPVGDNPAVGLNGGAMPMDYFGGTFSTLSIPQPNLPNIAFDVELYDKLRGRRIHDQKLPVETFQGGRFAHRKTSSPLYFEQGSKIQPRIFINEIRMGSVLDTDQAFNAASVKAYVLLVFKGVQQIEVPNV